jgi:hypothetical protein
MPDIWRINIKTAGTDPFGFCRNNQWIGVGWPVDGADKMDFESYERLAEQKYQSDRGRRRAISALRQMKVDDLCWARSGEGIYYLTRVRGEWKYRATREHRGADVVNVRRADWIKVGTVDTVPGKVANSFGLGGALRRVPGETIQAVSCLIHNELDGAAQYSVPALKDPNIFALLDDQELEDVVALYLQIKHDFLMWPSTCKKSTVNYEFVATNRRDKRTAVVQVKRTESLDRTSFRELAKKHEVYLFTTSGHYIGDEVDNVTCLTRSELQSLLESQRALLPSYLRDRLALAKRLVQSCDTMTT